MMGRVPYIARQRGFRRCSRLPSLSRYGPISLGSTDSSLGTLLIDYRMDPLLGGWLVLRNLVR